MSALGMASLGVHCQDKALGMASLGVHCDVDVIIPTPPRGGGGSGPGVAGENYYNQAPYTDKNEPLMLQQAMQEDEELIILLKAFAEVVQWH